MKVYSMMALKGPSLFSPQPCIVAVFSLDALRVATPAEYHSVVNSTTIAQLASIGLAPDSAAEKLALPTPLPLITGLAEELIRELELDCGPTIVTKDSSSNTLFLAFPEKDRLATSGIVMGAIRLVIGQYSQARSGTLEGNNAGLTELQKVLDSSARVGKRRTTKSMYDSLRAGSLPWLSLDFDYQDRDLFQIGFGRQQQLMRGMVAAGTSHIGVQVSNSKIKSLQFLSQLGFPVPRHAVVASAEQACKAAEGIGYPVVAKADVGTHGDRVFAGLLNATEVADAFHKLKASANTRYGNDIYVEEFVQGTVFRVEVIRGEFFEAYEMRPAGVTGDGEHCVSELIAIENQSPFRKSITDPTSFSLVRLELGAEELLMLKKQGLTADSIPAEEQFVRLCSTCNWSKGGTYSRVSHRVHADNQRLVERLTTALKIDLVGVDLISMDISRSFSKEELRIIEVNYSPDMGSYFDIEENKFMDMSSRIIRRLVPNVAYGVVPVIVFKDTPRALEAETLLAGMLNHLGYSAGLANAHGLEVNGELWAKPEQVISHNPGLQLLRNDTVGAAIIEHAPSSLADTGLGHGGCDIALILDCKQGNIVTPIWPEGIPSSKVDSFLANTARKTAIVLVEGIEGLELCRKCDPEKTVALVLQESEETEQLSGLGINCVNLLKHSDEGILLHISFQNNHQEKWLATGKISDPLPWLSLLATLLALDVDIDNIDNFCGLP